MLFQAWHDGFTVSSNFARAHAAEVAMLASAGLITTEWPNGGYGRTWRATVAGYKTLYGEIDETV